MGKDGGGERGVKSRLVRDCVELLSLSVGGGRVSLLHIYFGKYLYTVRTGTRSFSEITRENPPL